MDLKYKHVLFDLDGTIFDSYFANIDALLELLDERKPGHGEDMDSLARFFGTPGKQILRELGFAESDIGEITKWWFSAIAGRSDSVHPFPGIIAVLQQLKAAGVHLGIITSRLRNYELSLGNVGDHLPVSIKEFFEERNVVCCDDVENPKPAPDPILHYMDLHKASPDDVLFIGDTPSDLECADAAGVDFALALWGYRMKDYLSCSYYFKSPYEILSALMQGPQPLGGDWHKWAQELNAIGQIALAYEQNGYNRRLFERIKEISSIIYAAHTGEKPDKIRQALDFDTGYRTPKFDTRAAIFDEQGRILMVKEASGLWTLPGGWCDECESIVSNTIKEVREEAGLEVCCARLIAIVNRNRNNVPNMPYGVLRSFMLCLPGEGSFTPNIETTERRFFARDEIPVDELKLTTLNYDLILMCFEAYEHPEFVPIIE